MKKKSNILFVSPEVVPFAKTGGLADVAGALPKALAKAGMSIKVIMPKYKMINDSKYGLREIRSGLTVNVAGREINYALMHSVEEKSGLEFIFVDCPKYFNRDSLYTDPSTGGDWADNDERFIMFSKAVIESTKLLGFRPDIVHCNDWQSALVIAYLKTLYSYDEFFSETRTIFSIHNLAYQGNFPGANFSRLGLGPEYFYPTSPFEFWGKVSFMKAGIYYADIINTVSETYAKEIQGSNEFGYGMEGLLTERSQDVFGIVNGIDYEIWNPATDNLLPHKFSLGNLEGKKANKKALLERVGLPATKKDIPLIGIISRLADQKGFDLISEISEELLSMDLKIVILGAGEKKYHDMFTMLAKKRPKKISVSLTFDNPLAHLIEAGSDMFLMPSRYEPCGLNQLYSLKYGTIPIVRETGGLADTIVDYNESNGSGTGFVFGRYESSELLNTIKKALRAYRNKEAWQKLMHTAMAQDYSWDKSANRYIELYAKAINSHSESLQNT
ncbi:MAG: glycogen synthase GlgA [candidate division Zixibacteria bacterium CG_4_9_14_3_um_filter_46_8]|nr:MAG: glycogen synthase GlgA [candidate division Zixibacteria bacterium CG_4_9_14_3_um_filter_46_8]